VAPFLFSDRAAAARKVNVTLHVIASNSSRVSRWEWTQTALVAANLIWTTLCLGGYRPETRVITGVLTCVLLAVHFLQQAQGAAPSFSGAAIGGGANHRIRRVHPAGVWLLPFLVYAALNVLTVSPVPWLGWLDWLGWANMVATFWVVLNGVRAPRARQFLFVILVLLGVLAVALACYQRYVDREWLILGRKQVEQFFGRASGPFGIPNSLAAFLVLLLPATGTLGAGRGARAVHRVWWGWATAVLALGLVLTVSRGAWIALAIAFVVWPLCAAHMTWRRRGIVAGVVLLSVVCVTAAVVVFSPHVRARFAGLVQDAGELSRPILWRAAWNLFRDHPVTGTGAGSYNVLLERYRPEHFADDPQWAHNDYLNTLSDYGVIGFALFFGAVAVIVVRSRGSRATNVVPQDWLDLPAVRTALGIGVMAFGFQLFVDFHFKIPALAMACATVAALGLARRSAENSSGHVPSTPAARLCWLGMSVAVAAASVPVARFHRGEALRYSARQTLDDYSRHPQGDLTAIATDAEIALRQAVTLAPRNAMAWSDLAFALELRALATPSRIPELAGPAKDTARRALAISETVPEFWIRFAVAAAMQERSKDAQNAFERALSLAPRSAAAWYYYAHYLSFDTKERMAALRAIANCLSLDPGNTAAEALRVKLNARSPDVDVVP
jgi:O-antigen ligase